MLDGPTGVGGKPPVHPANGGVPRTFKFTLQSLPEKSRLKGKFTIEITFGLKGITHYATNVFSVSGKISGRQADIENLLEENRNEGPLFVGLVNRAYWKEMIRVSGKKVGNSLAFRTGNLQTKDTKFEVIVLALKSVETKEPLITFGPIEINI